jgi:LacI family xylobiose transport system transcriptional regulator
MSGTPTNKTRNREGVTLAQIARQAGVSVPTVSKVINGRTDISVQTRRLVQAIIHEQGYRPAPRASRVAPLLELAFHEFESEWAGEIILGVQGVAAKNDLGLVLSELEASPAPGHGWINGVLARRPMGVIAVLSDLNEDMRRQLHTRGIPLVVVDPTGEPLHDTPSVGAANWSGGLTATRHLLVLGHRRIAAIAGPEDLLCSRARLDGYRTAMDRAGVAVDPDLIRHGNFNVDAGRREGLHLLRLPEGKRPTAIFALNDLHALGVYQAARELQLHIPDDLSIVGFDDLRLAGWVTPPLTTIRQPLVQMAMTAAHLVLRLASGEHVAQTRVELATELVVRSSTGPIEI